MANNETTFVFRKTKYFWKFINKQFDITNLNDIFLDGGDNEGDYTFILAEQVPTDIYTCIDEDTGCLDENADGLSLLDLQEVYSNLSADLPMPYFKLRANPIQDWEGGFTLTLDSGATDIQIQVGDSQDNYLQGIFLCKRETKNNQENFVMAYATIPIPINIRNFINVPFDGLIMGVGYCATQ